MKKINRLGEIGYNKNGEKMTIIEYTNSLNIVVRFEDGYITKTQYVYFKNGSLKNSNVINVKQRIGEINYNTQGEKMTIIDYINSKDVTIKFDNEYIIKTTYTNFKKGYLQNKSKPRPIGEIGYNTNGDKMKIIKNESNSNITVEFENGYINKCSYFNFKKGIVSSKPKEDRTGEVNYNVYGSKMIIIKYIAYNNVIVQFDNEYITKTNYELFKNKHGGIKSPYDKSVFGIGYLGEGEYKASINHKMSLQYRTWSHMIQRCYDKKYKERRLTYKNCITCNEWLNYQNFAKWYDENYYKIDDERMEIDKDILHKGNKIYSPENCVFVPNNINTLFVKSDKARGKYPIGVCYDKRSGKYQSSCNNKGYYETLGLFNTPIKAFNVYKIYKEKLIKQIAEEYKSKIPQKLYDAMYNYIVEITD